jgi:hypothetical protein
MDAEDGLELEAFVDAMLKYLSQDGVEQKHLVASLCELFAQVPSCALASALGCITPQRRARVHLLSFPTHGCVCTDEVQIARRMSRACTQACMVRWQDL